MQHERAGTESFSRGTLDSLSSHIAVLDGRGVILATNEAWRQFATTNGLDWRRVSEGQDYLAVCDGATGLSAEAAAAMAVGIRDVLAGRNDHFSLEYPCHSPSVRRWFQARVTRFSADTAARAVVAHEDVTAQKAAEEAWGTAERRFESLFECAPDATVITNSEGFITLVNQQAERLFGYLRGEILGHPIEQLMPASGRAGHVALRQRYLRTAIPRMMGAGNVRFRALKKDGTEFPVEISLSPMDTDQGFAVVAAVRDVSERRQLEDQLRQSEALYRTLAEAARDLIFTVNCDGSLAYVNASGAKQLGMPPEQVIGKRIDQLIPPDVAAEPMRQIDTVLTTGEPVSVELEVPLPGGNAWLETWLVPITDAAGGTTAVLAVARDITERRRLETQVRQGQKMQAVGLLAGGVAHDFNNLLTVILGNTDFLLAEFPDGDARRAELADIYTAATSGASLARQLLAFSRQQILQAVVLDLNEVTMSTHDLLKRVIRENVHVALHLAEPVGSIRVDRGQLEQVLMNLAVNAQDAMPQGGTLTIETANVVLDEEYARTHPSVVPGAFVMLAVSDTGEGMTPDVQAHVFDPFFTTKAAGKGTGLGLATVYGIVKQCGGNIWVYSEPGRGASFKVYLPVVQETAEPVRSAASNPRTRLHGHETILVVEDNDAVRTFTRRVLEQAGYHVLLAANGEQALQLVARHEGPLDLLVTDVVMPGFDGRSLAYRVEAVCPGIKTLYMSGYTANAVVHHGELDADVAFLSKPFTANDLGRKVREVLER